MQQTNDKYIVYDDSSGALLNTDDVALLKYKAEVKAALERKQLENRVSALEQRLLALETSLKEKNIDV